MHTRFNIRQQRRCNFFIFKHFCAYIYSAAVWIQQFYFSVVIIKLVYFIKCKKKTTTMWYITLHIVRRLNCSYILASGTEKLQSYSVLWHLCTLNQNLHWNFKIDWHLLNDLTSHNDDLWRNLLMVINKSWRTVTALEMADSSCAATLM